MVSRHHTMVPRLHTMVLRHHAIVLRLHTMVPRHHAMVPRLQTMVLRLHTMVLRLHAIVPQLHTMVSRLHTMVARLRTIVSRLHTVAPRRRSMVLRPLQLITEGLHNSPRATTLLQRLLAIAPCSHSIGYGWHTHILRPGPNVPTHPPNAWAVRMTFSAAQSSWLVSTKCISSLSEWMPSFRYTLRR